MCRTDVVVIGSGVTGMAAAVTAAEGGLKVVVFEKQRSLGGTSNFFSGMFAVETERQRLNYITYSCDEAFKNIMEYSHWRANPRLVRAIVNESAETIAWLMQYGVEFRPETINMPEAPRTYHPVKGQGAAIIKALATAGKEKGIDFELGVPVQRIIKEDGAYHGCRRRAGRRRDRSCGQCSRHCERRVCEQQRMDQKICGFDLNVNANAYRKCRQDG